MKSNNIQKKNIFLTGASSGIGLDIAIMLNNIKSSLMISGRNEKFLKELSIKFKLTNPNFINYYATDLCNFSEIETMVEKLEILDGLILNAGIIDYTPAKSINEIKIKRIFETNVFSNILLVQQLLKFKKISNNASIIFISSIAAKVGVPGTSLYAASKGAINSYAKVLAFELSKLNIRVNVISPGVVKTNLITNTNVISNSQISNMTSKYPLGLGETLDITNLVEFLLSEKSKWITGSNINIDGGYLLNN